MKLYEISKEMQALDDLYVQSIDEETGEITNLAVIEELEKNIRTELENKGSGIIKVFQNINSNKNAIKNEIKRLKALEKSIDTKENNFKAYIIKNMKYMGIMKIDTELGTLSLRNSESAEIYDVSLVDERFKGQKIEYLIDKMAIKKAIKNEEEVQGARLVTNVSLNIK